MRNERGITLVELLAALAIVGLLAVSITSVLSAGSAASDRTAINQRLQQEANLIVEKIRHSYLENIPPAEEGCSKIKLAVNMDGDLTLDDEVISQGYVYSGLPTELCRTTPSRFYLKLEKEGLDYEINTTFSKLN